jgi:hypothetical protein
MLVPTDQHDTRTSTVPITDILILCSNSILYSKPLFFYLHDATVLTSTTCFIQANKVKVKVKFTLQLAVKAQRGSRDIALVALLWFSGT